MPPTMTEMSGCSSTSYLHASNGDKWVAQGEEVTFDGLSIHFDFECDEDGSHEAQSFRRRAQLAMPRGEKLKKLFSNSPPPQEWWDED